MKHIRLKFTDDFKPRIPKSSIKLIESFDDRDDSLKINTMGFNDLQSIVSPWTQEEGWPSTKNGLPAIYSIDPDGFYFLKKQDPIGSLSLVKYQPLQLGYLGFYMIRPDLRRKGLGSLLLDSCILYNEELGIESFGLNCLERHEQFYERFGFKSSTIDDVWHCEKLENSKSEIIENEEREIKKLDDSFFFKLVDYDASVFGTSREKYLSHWLCKQGTTVSVLFDKNKIRGYGVLSERIAAKPESEASYRIGPLYADDALYAKELFIRLLAGKPNVFMETSGYNQEVVALVNSLGFNRISSMKKMFRGQEPQQNYKKIYAYSSLATG